MKVLLRLLTAASLICCVLRGEAQPLHIYYDVYTDSLWFESDGKSVSKPSARKGREVSLHLLEFNHFLYDVKIEVEQQQEESESLGSALAMWQHFMPGMGILGGQAPAAGAASAEAGAFSATPLLSMPLFKMGGQDISLKQLLGGARGAEQLFAEINTNMQALSALQADMQRVAVELERCEKALTVSRIARQSLHDIKYNPALRPSTIRELSAEYCETMFRKNPGETVGLQDVLDWQNLPGQIKNLEAEFAQAAGAFEKKSAALNILVNQAVDLGIEDAQYTQYVENLQASNGRARDLSKRVGEYARSLQSNQSAWSSISLQELTAIQLTCREIQESKFVRDVQIPAEGDAVVITIDLLARDTTALRILGGAPGAKVRTKSITLPTRGGLKIRPTIGVHFSQFSSPAQKFGTQNDVIVADNADFFAPTVASMLNFYPGGNQRVRIGGAFGVGLPVLQANEDPSLQFFLGPTLVFGRSKQIMLSGGVLGGKVKRLARGFAVGDAFDPSFGDIPTNSRYELGYFVGLSFNFF